jgi:hypothetical protein
VAGIQGLDGDRTGGNLSFNSKLHGEWIGGADECSLGRFGIGSGMERRSVCLRFGCSVADPLEEPGGNGVCTSANFKVTIGKCEGTTSKW